MSYVQIEIGGKQRGLKYNTMALIEYQRKIKDSNEMSLFIAAVWAGLIANNYVKEIENDFTFEQVCDWCDEIENKGEVMEKVSAAIMETQEFKKVVKTQEEDKKEKKKA